MRELVLLAIHVVSSQFPRFGISGKLPGKRPILVVKSERDEEDQPIRIIESGGHPGELKIT